MINARIGVWNEEYEDFTSEVPLWDVMERVVEDSPDRSGTGNFLWPRMESPHNGERYGYDLKELGKIKADYVSHEGIVHFYAQYYNDPNDLGTQRIDRSKFQYYDEKHIDIEGDRVYYSRKRLNVYCAMDVAWSDSDRADYTAIAVIGIDHDGFIYVLDLDRFRTTNFNTYYERIQSLQDKWRFRKLVVETNAGGYLVAQEVEAFVRRNGGSMAVERRPATAKHGSKQEKWASVLEPRYESKSVFHRRSGLTAVLEEELMQAKPRNDDLKDAMCAAISISKPPASKGLPAYKRMKGTNVVVGRFGGRVKVR
jgi:phage terminase large subunit-like protein